MQKELKFKAWDGVDYLSNPFTLYDIQNGKIQFVPGTKIIQFTGLKDMHKKEIYDGDIIKFTLIFGFQSELTNEWKHIHGLESINGIGEHFHGVVVLDPLRGIMFKRLNNDYAEPMFTRHYEIRANHDWNTCEIAGNVFENPELLLNKYLK